MAPFERILVPTDFGPSAECALRAALVLGERFESVITLAHVFDLPSAPFVYERQAAAETHVHAAERILGEAVSEARRQYRSVDSLLKAGVASEQIIAWVKDRSFDLVVMGTHGYRGLDRVLIGSVALKVIRSSTVPVMIVPGEKTPRGAC